ncbi:zf-HC2 domain-containing protein [Streptomyces gobiensis]|nr:zf-HC2 domain-containing protein [Streptomyces gobiensis]UGY95221.1 zf-HC2 domain-containing protein [Streptomyces gobiensis]
MNRHRMNWHLSTAQAIGYADGSLPETDCWSVEKHLESCTECAGHVSAAVAAGPAAPVLAEVRSAVLDGAGARGRPAAVGRFARTARTARTAWAAGPALRRGWLLAMVSAAALAVGLARLAGIDGARPLLLAIAPVLPVLGVALSYGRHTDPLHELAASTPGGGLRLLLLRTGAVLGFTVPLLSLTALLLPSVAGGPAFAAWLLPGLALTLAALALGSYTGCWTGSAVVGAGWLLVVGTKFFAPAGPGHPARSPAGQLADVLSGLLGGPAAQGGWAAAAAVCTVLLAVRRTSFDYVERV